MAELGNSNLGRDLLDSARHVELAGWLDRATWGTARRKGYILFCTCSLVVSEFLACSVA